MTATRAPGDVGEPSRATRDLLLDWGERLFAERGIHGVSMREIGLAAGQRNNGVTQYHFGDKAGLIRAIFERRASEVNERRLELLEQVRSPSPSVHELVWAYVLPLGEQAQRGSWYVAFLARLQAEHQRDDLLHEVNDKVNTAYHRIRRELRRTFLADLSPDRFAIRWRIALNLAIDAIADHQNMTLNGTKTVTTEIFVAELVDAITAILTPRRP